MTHLILKAIRIVSRQQDNIFQQHECLNQLNVRLAPKVPLPHTRRYRGSPDFLLELHHLIKQHKPEFIVEASSGVSTLVAAYTLQQLGHGRIVSLENDARYARASRALLEEHGLLPYASVIHAPLTSFEIEGQKWLWYEISKASLPEQIDMVIIDGPPDRVQRNARYPALPLLIKRLSSRGLLILDDASRPTESRIIRMWQKRYKDLKVTSVSTEKGMAIISRGESQ
ncbi:MAG: class I SAM-dependent methyltransferase [Thiotrichales bacterium]